jgi:hypothetical protein
MAVTARLTVAVAGALLINWAVTVTAAEPNDGPFMVLSNGQITCGEFLADNPRSQAADTEWVLGYVSGRNSSSLAGSRNAGISFTAPDSVTAWLQNYCRTHSLDHLVEAAEELRSEFLRREGPH